MSKVVALKSSALISCEYDEKKNELFIILVDGTAETYVGVPKKEFEGLINAKSAGGYFNANIRDFYKFY